MSREAKEVTLAAVKALGALSTASDFIKEAVADHPEHTESLRSCRAETREARNVVDLIRKEKGLQTSGVVAGIRILESLGELVQQDLLSLEESNDQALGKVSARIRSARKSLTQQIRRACAGLAKSENEVTIDTKLVKSTDEAVRKLFGNDSGLDIARFVAELQRSPDAYGIIRLTESEYKTLTWQQIHAAHPETKTLSSEARSRVLCNCLARGQSIQILGPVAKDLWKDIAFIKIEGLIATDEAIQFGYPVTMEVFREGLKQQQQRITASRGR